MVAPRPRDLDTALETLELHGRLVTACALSFGDQLYRRTMAILLDAFDASLALFGYLEAPDSLVFPATTPTGSRRVDDPPALRLPPAEWTGSWGRALRDRRSIRGTESTRVAHLVSELPGVVATPVWSDEDLVGLVLVAGRAEPFTATDEARLERIAAFVGPFVRAHLAMVAAFRMRAAREAALAHVETELRLSERRYKELAELLPLTVFEVDPTGRFLYVNRHGLELSGYTETDLLQGLNLFDVMSPADLTVLRESIRAKFTGAADTLVDYRMVRKNGEEIVVRVHSTPILQDGRPIGLRGVLIDMTEVRRVQELASRAQRLETAGRIAGQVAHDFNNLLGPLIAYPELLQQTLPPDHPGLRYAGAMLESAQRLSEISQQLLALGRRGNYTLARHNLNQTVREAVRHVGADTAELDVVVELETELMPVLGGAAQLLRAVTNLVSNARQAMGDSGRLTLRTENVYLDAPTGIDRQVPRGEYVRVTVSDTGPGIAVEHRSRIFDPFFTTKPAALSRGSGLGLSSVHAIVEDHRGFVDLETELGRGTSFHLYFPIHRVDSGPPTPEDDALLAGTARLLVVDDDALQRDVARSLLEALGYTVRLAASGEEALQLLGDERPDLLVLDMILPDGIDGAETYRRVLALAPELRAIVVTGYARTERIQVARDLGVLGVVRKPLTLRSIGKAVRDALATAPRRS